MKRKYDGKLYGKGLLGDDTPPPRSPVKDKFVFPPYSVWVARDGFWQSRKRKWLALGIQSELGRDKKVIAYYPISYRPMTTGISVFDPVVCELCYSWFCKPGGQIIDPFAGGSVRGVVASIMGYRYWGNDLNKRQIRANVAQLGPYTTGRHKPIWVSGDSQVKVETAPRADFIFTCPPYGDLELYGNDPDDLSNMPRKKFINKYYDIIANTCARLRENRFACIVVGNYRDRKTGTMCDLVGDTIRGFEEAGLRYFNEIILVHPVGTGAVRVATSFERGGRKIVKMHQNVLVFAKGQAEELWRTRKFSDQHKPKSKK